jgi:hypothetical protein
MHAARTPAHRADVPPPAQHQRWQSPPARGQAGLDAHLPPDGELLARFGDAIDDRIAEILDELLEERNPRAPASTWQIHQCGQPHPRPSGERSPAAQPNRLDNLALSRSHQPCNRLDRQGRTIMSPLRHLRIALALFASASRLRALGITSLSKSQIGGLSPSGYRDAYGLRAG